MPIFSPSSCTPPCFNNRKNSFLLWIRPLLFPVGSPSQPTREPLFWCEVQKRIHRNYPRASHQPTAFCLASFLLLFLITASLLRNELHSLYHKEKETVEEFFYSTYSTSPPIRPSKASSFTGLWAAPTPWSSTRSM